MERTNVEEHTNERDAAQFDWLLNQIGPEPVRLGPIGLAILFAVLQPKSLLDKLQLAWRHGVGMTA